MIRSIHLFNPVVKIQLSHDGKKLHLPRLNADGIGSPKLAHVSKKTIQKYVEKDNTDGIRSPKLLKRR